MRATSGRKAIGVEVLPAILAALRERRPKLQLELVLSNRLQDVVQRAVDIAVRMAAPKQAVLPATRVDDVTPGLHAHRACLPRQGEPKNLADLSKLALIGFDQETRFLRLARSGLPVW